MSPLTVETPESIFIYSLKGCDTFNKVKYMAWCVTLNREYRINMSHVDAAV